MGGVVNNPDCKFCCQSIRYIYIYYEKLEESQNSINFENDESITYFIYLAKYIKNNYEKQIFTN